MLSFIIFILALSAITEGIVNFLGHNATIWLLGGGCVLMVLAFILILVVGELRDRIEDKRQKRSMYETWADKRRRWDRENRR